MTTPRLLRGLRRCALALLPVVAAVSCGTSTGSTVATSPGGLIVITDGTIAPDVRPEPQPSTTTSRDDLLDEHRITPTAVEVDPTDPATLVVRFDGGTAPCHGVRLAVDEGPADVTVVLFAGTPPEGVGLVCPAVAVEQELRWTLERPLGTRELYWDGV